MSLFDAIVVDAIVVSFVAVAVVGVFALVIVIVLGLAAGAGNAAAKHLARVACQDRSPKRPRDARFWAQNDRFGPDVVTFGVNPSQKNQVKMTQNNPQLPHLAQTQVLGPKS